jgi:hypothetical protein
VARGQILFFSFFWLFVAKMTIQRDDDVLPSGFFFRQTLQARSQVVNQKLLNGFVDIAVPYLTMGDGGW